MASKAGPQGIDFTIFFRALGDLPCDLHLGSAGEGGGEADGDPVGGLAQGGEGGGEDGLAAARAAAIGGMDDWPAEHVAEWRGWAKRYWARVAAEGRSSGAGETERRTEMSSVNPKYILRNWMAAEAYEAAARGDSSVIEELMR
eukprot:scaffold10479_cov87-Isochrysis_galbana.AAC.1